MFNFMRHRLVPAIGACAAVALLAACSGLQQGGGAVPAVQQTPSDITMSASPSTNHPNATLTLLAKTLKSGKVLSQHHVAGKSWIDPDIKGTLIYASDPSNGAVDIYHFGNLTKRAGQITGLDMPYGECVDKSANVYVVDFSTANIYEYPHGSTHYSKMAVDNYGYPIGCSVDPTTGNVAVANFQGYNYSTGGIVIFKGGLSGAQSYFTQASVYFMWPPAYDRNGNLFVEGYDSLWYYTAFAELPHGGNTIEILAGVSIGFPAGVQSHGSTVLAADQGYKGTLTTAIYDVAASGSTAYVTHTSVLTDNCFMSTDDMDSVQPYAYNGKVVVGNGFCNNRYGFWSLANGGNPMTTMPVNVAPYNAYGQVVSP